MWICGESGDADDMPLNKLQKKVLPYAGKKRGPKTKAEKALAAMAAGAAELYGLKPRGRILTYKLGGKVELPPLNEKPFMS